MGGEHLHSFGHHCGLSVTGSMRRQKGRGTMIDTSEGDLARASLRRSSRSTRSGGGPRTLCRSQKQKPAKPSPDPVFPAHTHAPRLSSALREKRIVSLHDRSPHRKYSTTCAATCRRSATKISHSPLLAAPLFATKISTNPRSSVPESATKIRPRRTDSTTGMLDHRHAVATTRSTDR